MKLIGNLLSGMLLVVLSAGCAQTQISLSGPGRIPGLKPLKSVSVALPVSKIQAKDGSFTLTAEPFPDSPFYLNDKKVSILGGFKKAIAGPVPLAFIQDKDWVNEYLSGRKPVLVYLEGRDEPLSGLLAIFPVEQSHHSVPDSDNVKASITVTPEALAQMDKEGIGISTGGIYSVGWAKVCQWALWISREDTPK